jgi:hypothetical protein
VEVAKAIVAKLIELGVAKGRIAVIAPYRAQRKRLREELDEGVEVATVDAFQGREKDVVVFSATATEAGSTRARYHIYKALCSRASEGAVASRTTQPAKDLQH